MSNMVKKIINFQVKQIGNESDRLLEFIGSTEAKDRDGDIIDVGGWDLDEYLKNPVVLGFHDYGNFPFAKSIKTYIEDNKLKFQVKFPTIEELTSYPKDSGMVADHAKDVDMCYNMYKNSYMNAVSVGFAGTDYEPITDKGKYSGTHYKKQKLFELSLVPVPANQEALVEAKSKGLITDKDIKTLFNAEIKQVDLDGSPSVYDIMRAIQEAINPNWMYNIWIEDLYPKNYPSGNVAVSKDKKYYMYDYTFENGVVTLGATPVEIQDAYVAKSVDNTNKSIKSLYIEKAGATISSKNKELITEACKSIMQGHDMMKGLIIEIEDDEDEEAEDETGEKSLKMVKSNKVELPDEVKQAFSILNEKIDKLTTSISIKELDVVDKGVEFDLESIDVKSLNLNLGDELNFTIDEIKSVIAETINNKINAITGKI